MLLIVLSILCFFTFKKNKNEQYYRFYLFTILTTSLSIIVYLNYKFFYDYLLFIIAPIPTRVINTHAMITYPTIIMSSIYLVNYISNYIKVKNIFIVTIFGFFLLVFYILNHNYENLEVRLKKIYKMRFEYNYSKFVDNFKKETVTFMIKISGIRSKV